MPKFLCVLLFASLTINTFVKCQSQIVFYDTMENYTFNWISNGTVKKAVDHNSTTLYSPSSLQSHWIFIPISYAYSYIQLNVSISIASLHSSSFCELFYLINNNWILLDRYNNQYNGQLLNKQYALLSASRLKIKFTLDKKKAATCTIHEVCVLGYHNISTTQFETTALASTVAPTSVITIYPNISAIFSDNYLKIYITITFNADNVIINTITNNHACDDIFVDTQLLGADARCIWHENDLEIQLSSNSIIDIKDRLVIRADAFDYIYSDKLYTLQYDTMITVFAARNPVEPLLIIDDLEPTLGICDDLILNAAFTQYLGGRNAFFEWLFISSASDSNSYLMSMGALNGEIVVIPASNIDINSQLSLQLRVSTWFNTTTSEIFTIYKSEQLVPHITLSGPHSFSVTNYNYKHDYIHIVSDISYNVDCINTSSASFPYSLLWFVSSSTLSITSLDEIQSVLSNIHTDSIALDTSLIHPGNDYIFTAKLVSNFDSTNASLSVFYDYSEIMCSINSASAIYLDSITEEQFLNDYILFLDGYTMTYDPNAIDVSSKAHLTFNWQCFIPQYNMSCDELFATSSLSTEFVKYISFSSSVYNMYRFTMIVSDSQQTNRNSCVSSLDLVLDLKPNQNVAIQYLTVSISVNSNTINSKDRLRVIVQLIASELNHNEYYQYEWIEANDFISKTDLKELNINDGLNGNLILESNVLQKGYLYTLKVNVTKWLLNSDTTSTLIANGISPTIDIEVLNGPMLSELTIYPQCNQTYQSLSELLNVKHYISAIGNGDYLPLFYEFVYFFESETTLYEYSIHPSLLFKPYVLDVMLPFGSFTLKAIVYDSKASSSWKEIQCNIAIQDMKSDDECMSLMDDKLDSLDSQSTTKVVNDILQLIPIYMQYIDTSYSHNTQCLTSALSEIISVFNDPRILQNINFCETDWSLSLARIYATCFDLLIEFEVVYDLFTDEDDMDGIRSIISLIFDPCDTLSEVITDVDLLYLSPQSIIDGNVIIYYGSHNNAVDITNSINQNILSDAKSARVLYELCSSLITIMNMIEAESNIITDDIIDLLSKSLYIHALYSIATSIPGESVESESDGFEIYSSRIGIDGDVNVALHDIQIKIDNDVFADGRDSFCDLTQAANNCVYDSVDIIIIAQNNTKHNAVIATQNECDDNISRSNNGTISNNSISIVIIGGNLSTSSSNATITFTEDKYHEELHCVWLDETTTSWKDTGCSTIVNEEFNTIECDCNHLTTFSIAYNINMKDECDNILAQMMLNPIKWNALHIIFAILFMFLCLYAMHQLLPFMIHKKFNPFKDQMLLSISSVFIISLINVVLCISFTSIALYSANIPFLTFLLLSPQWFYFIIFGIVLYSWVIVAQSLDHQQQSSHSIYSSSVLSKALQITTIVLIACGILEFIIVSFLKQSSQIMWIYTASQIFWISLLLLASVIFSVFGYKTQQIVRITSLLLRSVESNSNTKTLASSRTDALVDQNVRLSYKLLFTTIVVTSFFFIQCILCIYFLAISHYKHMFAFRILDLLSHYICLVVICWLYKQTFKRLRVEYEIKPLCHLCDMQPIYSFMERFKPHKDRIQTRQTAPSVSVVSAGTILTRNTSNSLAKSDATNTRSKAPLPPSNPPSVQMSEKSHDQHLSTTLKTIKEAFNDIGPASDLSLSLSLIDNDNMMDNDTMEIKEEMVTIAFEESDSRQNKAKQKPKPKPKTRVSIFQRKELLQLSTVKLAKMCRQQNISSKGKKADLVNRLLAAAKNNKKSAVRKPPKLDPVRSSSYE